jgi:hypothetical protein
MTEFAGENCMANEKFCNFVLSPNARRMIKSKEDFQWTGQIVHIEDQNTHTNFVGKLEGKRPLARHRRRWEVNIKLDRKEICSV